jgi:hypothetical protein
VFPSSGEAWNTPSLLGSLTNVGSSCKLPVIVGF